MIRDLSAWALAAFLLPRAAAAQGAWSEAARMPTARCEMRAALIDSLIYVPGGYGGLNRLEAFNPATNLWKTLKEMPVGLNHHMVAAHGGKLYVLQKETLEYDPAANAWTRGRKPGRYYRSDGAAVALGEYLYVIGGQGVKPMERYAPREDAWTELAPMREIRGHVQAVAVEGRIWVLGGRDGTTPHKTVEIYDPASNTWSDGPPMGDFHAGHAAAVVGGRILVAGGERWENNAPWIIKTAEILDPKTGSWSFLPAMPAPVHGCASIGLGGRLYVLGGSYQPYAAVNSDQVQVFEPSAGILIRPVQGGGPAGFLWQGRDLLGRLPDRKALK